MSGCRCRRQVGTARSRRPTLFHDERLSPGRSGRRGGLVGEAWSSGASWSFPNRSPEMWLAADGFGRARAHQSGEKKNHRAYHKFLQGEKGIGTRERSWSNWCWSELYDLTGGSGGVTSSTADGLVALKLGFWGQKMAVVVGFI